MVVVPLERPGPPQTASPTLGVYFVRMNATALGHSVHSAWRRVVIATKTVTVHTTASRYGIGGPRRDRGVHVPSRRPRAATGIRYPGAAGLVLSSYAVIDASA